MEGLRQCHLRDAAALVNFFAWLEEELELGNQTITECSASEKLAWFRSQQTDFVTPSFDTICAVGSNAAIIHYKPSPTNCSFITKDQLLLLDSGGQFKFVTKYFLFFFFAKFFFF